ncbi:hypothetical protein MXB_5214 [Myxobolus squamalis]|nr:hypothetical protein MXB_5214 [Myxobolus squamalis]
MHLPMHLETVIETYPIANLLYMANLVPIELESSISALWLKIIVKTHAQTIFSAINEKYRDISNGASEMSYLRKILGSLECEEIFINSS